MQLTQKPRPIFDFIESLQVYHYFQTAFVDIGNLLSFIKMFGIL